MTLNLLTLSSSLDLGHNLGWVLMNDGSPITNNGQLFLLLATDNMKLGTVLSGGRWTFDGQRCLRQRTAELLAHSMWRCDVDFDLRYRNSDFFREELILLVRIV